MSETESHQWEATGHQIVDATIGRLQDSLQTAENSMEDQLAALSEAADALAGVLASSTDLSQRPIPGVGGVAKGNR